MTTPEKPRIERGDRWEAMKQSISSALIAPLPDSWNLVGYAKGVESYVAVRWRHAATPAATISNWITYPGEPTSGAYLPKDFTVAAITHVDRNTINTHLNRFGGLPAVAYRLGSTVMFGVTDREPIMQANPVDGSDMRFAMRVGKDDLSLVLGAYNSARSRGERFVPLAGGMQAGEVVPVNELPNTIPLL